MVKIATVEHGPHIDLAQVFTTDTLPDATLSNFVLGLGPTPRVHRFVHPQSLGFCEHFGGSVSKDIITYDLEELGHKPPTVMS